MTHRRRTTASALALALAAAVLAPTVALASAQARVAAPDVIDRTGLAAGQTSVTHRVFIALPTGVGTLSKTDGEVLTAVSEVTQYWKDEADGRIADFVVPADTAQFKTFEPAASAAEVCTFAPPLPGEVTWPFADQARALFPGANFDPFEGGTDLLVVVTPDKLPDATSCPIGSPAGYAPIGPGFHAGGVVMVRSIGALRSSLAHEMGHTFGFGHSNNGDVEYRNIYNVMGTAIADVALPVLSTAYRVGANIADADEVTTVQIPHAEQVATSTHVLEPRSADAGLRGLAVTPPDTRKTFYVEYRSGTGRDAGSAYAATRSSDRYWFRPGVVIEEIRDDGDGVGVSLLPYQLKTDAELGEAATGAGELWISPSGTVSVSVGAVSATEGAEVTVTYIPPITSFSGGEVEMSGQPTFGSTLTAEAKFDQPAEQVDWQWFRGDDAIPLATGSSYQVTDADVDQVLSVRATAYAPGVLPTSVVSGGAYVPLRDREWWDLPKLTSELPVVGETLAVAYNYSDGPATVNVVWYVDGTFTGHTGDTFLPTADLVNKTLMAYVSVTGPGWNNLGAFTSTSAQVKAADPNPDPGPGPSPGPSPSTPTPTVPAPTTPVPTPLPTPLPTPTPGSTTPTPPTPPSVPGALTGPKPVIKGKAVVGKRLRAKTGMWPAGTTFKYRWLANGKVIRKATSATLTIKAGLVGKRLSVRVTAAKPGYTSVALVSARTKRVVD